MSESPTLSSDHLTAIRARLQGISNRAAEAAKAAQQIVEEADALWADLIPEGKQDTYGTLKREDGRLNDQGIKAINAAFESGMGVVEAAKAFGISPSAASTRRSRWKASRTAR